LPDTIRGKAVHKPISNERAFTLIEIIACLVLVGILASTIGLGLVQIVQGYTTVKTNVKITQTAQIAMTRVVKELSLSTAVNSSPAPTATSISYTRGGSTHTISLSGALLQVDSTTLIDSVTTFSLAYLDASGNTTATVANIRQIVVTLGAGSAPSIATSVTLLEDYY
jgi:prepilin-type N-terminal cleavage/methylation domain-containing protein